MNANTTTSIDLDRAVVALADALDLVGVDKIGHGFRVGLMAAACALEMGWDENRRHKLLRAGLLHDCGVSSTREHRTLVNVLYWDGARQHAERGARYLEQIASLADLAPIVRDHHTPWSELTKRNGMDERTALESNLIFLVDRADTARDHGITPGIGVAKALTVADQGAFAPALMDAFNRVAAREAFWFAQEEPWLHARVTELMCVGTSTQVGMDEIRGLAQVFSRIVDAKSPFTERHSAGVAALSLGLGEHFGIEANELEELELAALLHDLGKLGVPDDLLDKTGPLTAEERRIMAKHAFDTYEILRHVFGDGHIAQWAALHHETPSGHGYPFHTDGGDLPLAARIIAVADVVQALAQRRPYRDGLDTETIVNHLNGMVFAGKLDRDVVEAFKAKADDFVTLALSSEI